MTHFSKTDRLFIDRLEESMVLNDREKEYVTYDYDYYEDIIPHLVNMFTDKQVEIKRELKNIKIFRRGQLPGMVFRDFEFVDFNTINKITEATNNFDIQMIVFINCRFGGMVIDTPSCGMYFYDCTFDDRLELCVNTVDGLHYIEFAHCTINAQLNFNSGFDRSHSVTISNCLFNENSSLNARDYRKNSGEIFDRIEIQNCIFKGDVNFEGANIPDLSVFQYLTFYREVNFNNAKLGSDIVWQNICFAPFVNKLEKNGFKSFTKALNDYGYKKEAKYYETHYGDGEAKKVDKTEYDIAVESGWLNIKQAALFLGMKYSSLLDMRKDDKTSGLQRIPYVGEGKNSRYYVPLLKAYKDKNMKKVSELEKEMRSKENEA